MEYLTLQSIEELFELSNGYVLDFTNNGFQKFVKGVIGIDIYGDEGYQEHTSKAKKLRQILDTESNLKIAKLINALLSCKR